MRYRCRIDIDPCVGDMGFGRKVLRWAEQMVNQREWVDAKIEQRSTTPLSAQPASGWIDGGWEREAALDMGRLPDSTVADEGLDPTQERQETHPS